LNTTPTALKTFRSLPSHEGQSVNESSVKLWTASKAWPHMVHSYW